MRCHHKTKSLIFADSKKCIFLFIDKVIKFYCFIYSNLTRVELYIRNNRFSTYLTIEVFDPIIISRYNQEFLDIQLSF